MKKIIASILIPSLLFYLTGCYTMNEITKEDFKEGSRGNATLLTNKMETYRFDEGQYYIKADTLNGNGFIVNGGLNTPFSGNIALEDIAAINVEEPDGFKTFLLTIGIIAGAVLIAYTIITVTLIDGIFPDQ